jgi:Flp pilus assembly protein TadB
MGSGKQANGGEHQTYNTACCEAYKHFPYLGDNVLWQHKDLEKAIDLLDIDIKPKEIHALSMLTFLASFLITFLVIIASILTESPFAPVSLFFLVLPALLYFYIEKYPTMLLEAKKTEMLGYIPSIASYLVISLRISPILETAVEFASDHTTGFPRKLLKRIIFDINMGKGTSIVESLSKFADEWGDVPEFKAFMQLLIASTLETDEKGRWLMLDNGMNVLLSGLKERTDSAVRSLETPILGIFMFLVIFPMIFVSVIPMLPAMGFSIPQIMVFFLYDIMLPIILYIAISFVSSSKPITIPPIDIPESEYSKIFGIDASKKDNRYAFYLFVVLTGGMIALPGFMDLFYTLQGLELTTPFGTSLILIGVCTSLGMYWIGTSYSVKVTRDEIKQEEDEFAETLRQLSVLLSSGRALPNAMAHISDLNKGNGARIFTRAANNIRLFNINMRDAFFGEKEGSASKIYSGMIHGALDTIISMSGRSARSIASVIIRLSEHIRNMRAVDTEMKKIIGNVTVSMIIIAVLVGPLIGAVSTSLGYLLAKTLSSGGIEGSGFNLGIDIMNPEIVKLIIGVYVLETTLVLVVFADDLTHGGDKIIKKYHLGMYLPIAALIFATASYVMSQVFGGMI